MPNVLFSPGSNIAEKINSLLVKEPLQNRTDPKD